MSDTAPAPHVPTDAVALPSGARMPLLGFGTWQIKGQDAVTATAAALEAGYRHLDTATVYGNEAEVGAAMRASGLDREDVFVTTKCPGGKVGEERDTLTASLDAIGTDYVDLWLIHWPVDDVEQRADMWAALVEARDVGLVRDIGVSNYSVEMIDDVARRSGVTPSVNQIEWSPFLYDESVVAAHRDRGVLLEGYSALRGGTLTDPTIVGIGERLGRTPAQVIVRWHLQHGTVVIPKSAKAERIRANADVADFELTAEDMAALDALRRP
jgi:2,5-diketo-D-gluconate reductase A